MGSVDVLREITPLSPEDCFLVMQRPKRSFSYPLHVHPEFELNYLENAAGAIRIVGDSVEEMEELDLLLVAGGAKHAYSNHKCLSTDMIPRPNAPCVGLMSSIGHGTRSCPQSRYLARLWGCGAARAVQLNTRE